MSGLTPAGQQADGKMPMEASERFNTVGLPRCLVEDIAAHLSDEIIEGKIQPGQQIIEADLQRTLGVSRAPLREALLKLEGQGLVKIIPRKGTFIRLKFFDEGCKALASGQKPRLGAPACGAGRGMVLIDVNGDIWPCHRWSKKREGEWRLGSIYEPWFNYQARGFINSPKTAGQLAGCRKCKALFICSGGCPAEDLEDTGSIYDRHPNGCHLNITLAELIRQFHDTLFAEKNPVFMKAYYKNDPTMERRESK